MVRRCGIRHHEGPRRRDVAFQCVAPEQGEIFTNSHTAFNVELVPKFIDERAEGNTESNHS
jgi:hypothetical protein